MVYVRSQRCEGTSRTHGGPCKQYAIRGARFCRNHGGALPAVREEARRNVAQQEILLREAKNPLLKHERRHPSQVLLDALHTADVMHREALRLLDEGYESLTPDQRADVSVALDRAAKTAKLVYDARWVDIETRSHEMMLGEFALQGEVIARFVTAVIAPLGLTREQEDLLDEMLRRELPRLEEYRADAEADARDARRRGTANVPAGLPAG